MLLVELGEYESGQQPDGAAEAAHEVRYLLGGADADEEQRQLGGLVLQLGELPDEVLLGPRDIAVADGILQAEDHGDHSAAGLLADVGGQ